MRARALLSILGLAATVAAHPGHDHAAEAAVRREYLEHSRRDLSHCAEHLKARGHTDRQIARRQELLRTLVLSRGLETRALEDINKSHHSEQNYTLETPPELLFAGNNSCVLSPEVTEGPYCKWHASDSVEKC